jgi:HlyD family secretion protein
MANMLRASSLAAVRILSVVVILVVPAQLSHGVETPSPSAQHQAAINEIMARGYIEPLSRVIAVSGPPDGNSTVALVSKLLVEQGSKVEAGQVVAILNGYDLARTDLDSAKASLELAKAQRAQVQAGSGKESEIAAQANVIASRRSALVRTKKDYARTAALVRDQYATVQDFDTQSASLDQATNDVQQAENTLKSLTEVRQVDDAVAAAQIVVAEANLAKAEAEVDRLQIRAPIAGTVLSLQARDGEAIQTDGILRMGDLDHLIVLAEVDQAQIGRITEGMSATIEGPMVPQSVEARVTRIAKEVFREKRPSSDILVGRDAKIVEVEVTPKTALPPVVGGEVVVHFIPAASAQK